MMSDGYDDQLELVVGLIWIARPTHKMTPRWPQTLSGLHKGQPVLSNQNDNIGGLKI